MRNKTYYKKLDKVYAAIQRLRKNNELQEVYLYDGNGAFPEDCIAFIEMRDLDDDGNEVVEYQDENLVRQIIRDCGLIDVEEPRDQRDTGSNYDARYIGIMDSIDESKKSISFNKLKKLLKESIQ